MTNELIPAATILLLRDAPAFQVLMVERHAQIAFAGGAMVFPGGRVDTGDAHADWLDHADGLSDIEADARSSYVAALREAFEETGILIARRDGQLIDGALAEKLAPWRTEVEKDDIRFLDLMRSESLRLAVDSLRLFARWRPPQNVGHRRYDTMFFAAPTPAGQRATPDGGEATDVVWTSPQEAIDAREQGRWKMVFPTIRNVELLGCSDSVRGVFNFAQERTIRPVEPFVVKKPEGAYLTISDDLGYPVTQEGLETASRF